MHNYCVCEYVFGVQYTHAPTFSVSDIIAFCIHCLSGFEIRLNCGAHVFSYWMFGVCDNYIKVS